MALVVKDRVKETTTTTGTGTVTLGGAVSGFQTFTSVLSNADTTYYAIIDYTNNDFEVGLGTFTSSGTTLARTTILESSNSGSAVDLESGTKEVFITYPAEKSVYLDASNQLVINGTAVTASATDLNLIDGITNGTVIASKAIITDSNKDISGGRNITISGELDAATLDISGNADIDGTLEADAITIDGVTLAETISDTVGAMVSSNTETNITVTYDDSDNTLDFVIGTLNQDTTGNAATATALETARTIHGVSFNGTANIDLSEVIEDTVGAMFSSNTETNITATYQDGDGTIDLVIGTLNQDTTGTADNFTVSANNSTDETVYPVFVDGATGSQGAETDTGLTYNPSTGLLTSTGFSGNLTGTLQTAAQANVTSLGTLTTLTIDNVIINGSTIGHTGDTDLMTVASGVLTVAGEVDATSLDISGDVDVDGTLEADAITVNGTALSSVISGTTVDLATSITISANNSTDETVYPLFVDGATGTQGAETDTGLTYNPSSGMLTSTGFTGALTGNASTATILETARTLGGVSFNGSANINLPGVNTAGNQNTSGNAATATLASTVTVTDSTANTNFPVVFHDESNSLLDDTGALRYNPSTGELLVPKLTVAGATTVVDTVTMNAANAIVFEGATADAHETTLSIVDPTADHTQYLINQGGYIPVLAATTTTAITATPDEINLIDGGTSRGTTAVASGDGILINDAGTMRMTNVDTVSTYFASHSVGGGNIVTVGALNDGSITSGFGTIDTGSSTITTTGLISGGSLDIDNVLINGTTIGHTDDTDLITVADGLVTIAGEISTTTLDIGGTNVTSTAAELNILDGVTSTATELNIMDGNTSASSTTLADADRVVANDNGTMKQVALTDIKTYLTSAGYASQDDATALAIALG